MAEGERPKNKTIHQAEDRGVCADSERQCQHGDRCEPGRFPQCAQTKLQILYEVLNQIYTPRVAAFLFGLLDTT